MRYLFKVIGHEEIFPIEANHQDQAKHFFFENYIIMNVSTKNGVTE